MKQFMRQRQQGMTFIGLLCILAMVGFIGYAGVRLVPVYLNYMKLARTMESAATEFKGETRIRAAYGASPWTGTGQIEDITVVEQKDIEITKDDGGLQLHVAYDDWFPTSPMCRCRCTSTRP
jgi:type II secretory pathway pseudopilin PulG